MERFKRDVSIDNEEDSRNLIPLIEFHQPIAIKSEISDVEALDRRNYT